MSISRRRRRRTRRVYVRKFAGRRLPSTYIREPHNVGHATDTLGVINDDDDDIIIQHISTIIIIRE